MNSVASSANSMGPMGPFGSGPALGFQPGAQGTNNPNLVILNLGGMQEDKVYNHNIETESGQKIHIQSSMTSQDGNSSGLSGSMNRIWPGGQVNAPYNISTSQSQPSQAQYWSGAQPGSQPWVNPTIQDPYPWLNGQANLNSFGTGNATTQGSYNPFGSGPGPGGVAPPAPPPDLGPSDATQSEWQSLVQSDRSKALSASYYASRIAGALDPGSEGLVDKPYSTIVTDVAKEMARWDSEGKTGPPGTFTAQLHQKHGILCSDLENSYDGWKAGRNDYWRQRSALEGYVSEHPEHTLATTEAFARYARENVPDAESRAIRSTSSFFSQQTPRSSFYPGPSLSSLFSNGFRSNAPRSFSDYVDSDVEKSLEEARLNASRNQGSVHFPPG